MPRHSSICGHGVRASVFACLLLFSACAWNNEVTAAQDETKEFQAMVQKYLEIQKKALSTVPPIGTEVTDAALIVKHEKEVADAIRALRPDAKPGEIFTADIRRMITATVKQQTAGKGGVDAKAAILDDGNPKGPETPAPITLEVNAPYPATAPLSTVPPSVLLALPTLPKGVEFRFVGRTLILRDTRANMIVDLIPDVL